MTNSEQESINIDEVKSVVQTLRMAQLQDEPVPVYDEEQVKEAHERLEQAVSDCE